MISYISTYFPLTKLFDAMIYASQARKAGNTAILKYEPICEDFIGHWLVLVNNSWPIEIKKE